MSDRISSRQRKPGNTRPESAETAASVWLARRDRGLTAEENAEFSAWVAAPENARMLSELEGPFAALDRAARLRPRDGSPPDPDFLRSVRTGGSGADRKAAAFRRASWWVGGGAAAAAMVMGIFFFAGARPEGTSPAMPGVVVRHTPERHALPDGSTVELKKGTQMESIFTARERRVRLTPGEAHFTVAKDADRPFVVLVGNVEVRALGTAFTIHASRAALEVVVTEGRVRVDDTAGRNLIANVHGVANTSAAEPARQGSVAEPSLDAGQHIVIPVGSNLIAPVPASVATAEVMERTSAWRSVWLEFGDMPLADVVQEFNRNATDRDATFLRIADELTGRVLVSGTFRADSAEAFVRLLKSSFGITAIQGGDGSTLLRKAD